MQTAAIRRTRQLPFPPTVNLLELLRYMADRADVLDLVTTGRSTDDEPNPVRWVLVPMSGAMLAQLELFDSASDDLEEGADDEPADEDEEDGSDEMSAVRPDTMSRAGLVG